MPTHQCRWWVGAVNGLAKIECCQRQSNLQRGNPLPLDPPYFLERSEFNDKPAGDRVRAADVGWVRDSIALGVSIFFYDRFDADPPSSADGGSAQSMV